MQFLILWVSQKINQFNATKNTNNNNNNNNNNSEQKYNSENDNNNNNSKKYNFAYDWDVHQCKIRQLEDNIDVSIARNDLEMAIFVAVHVQKQFKLKTIDLFDRFDNPKIIWCGVRSIYQEACEFDIVTEIVNGRVFLIESSKNKQYIDELCEKVSNGNRNSKGYISDSVSTRREELVNVDDSTFSYLDCWPEIAWKKIFKSAKKPNDGMGGVWYYWHGANKLYSQVLVYGNDRAFHAKTQTNAFIGRENGNENDSLTMAHVLDTVIIEDAGSDAQKNEFAPLPVLWGKTLQIAGSVRESDIICGPINCNILLMFDINNTILFLEPKYVKLSQNINVTDRVYAPFGKNVFFNPPMGISKQYYNGNLWELNESIHLTDIIWSVYDFEYEFASDDDTFKLQYWRDRPIAFELVGKCRNGTVAILKMHLETRDRFFVCKFEDLGDSCEYIKYVPIFDTNENKFESKYLYLIQRNDWVCVSDAEVPTSLFKFQYKGVTILDSKEFALLSTSDCKYLRRIPMSRIAIYGPLTTNLMNREKIAMNLTLYGSIFKYPNDEIENMLPFSDNKNKNNNNNNNNNT